ncbi:MAG: alkaline phosphatase D family protein [Pikeienuella sp.]
MSDLIDLVRDLRTRTLPEGIASGDVSEDSIVLWTRTTALGDVTFTVFDESGLLPRKVAEMTVEATDPEIPVKVVVEGLEPGTAYSYTVKDASRASLTGEFTTAHAAGYNGLRFGVTGDWRGDLNPYSGIANMDERELDFAVLLGDTVYHDIPSLAGLATTEIDGMRAKYREVYGSRAGENFWADAKASTPVFATIDDHEVFDNFAGGATADTEDRVPEVTGFVNDTVAFENGLQVFQEYHPIEDVFYGFNDDPRFSQERQLYRTQNFGDDAAIFILDQRSFRDTQIDSPEPDDDPAFDDPEIQAYLQESFDPSRTLLGRTQLNQVKADLLAAEEDGITWKFVNTPEPIQDFGEFSTDAWGGYEAERTDLLNFIEDNDIDNVVFIAADIHGTFVNNIYNRQGPNAELTPTGMWEITTGSVGFWPGAGATAIGLGTLDGDVSFSDAFEFLSLPTVPDMDDVVDDRDDFVKAFYNEQRLAPLGLDPLGLDDNLPEADGLIDAELLQGDWVAANSFGWTEFEIDAQTQDLTVTTWGVPEYTTVGAIFTPFRVSALEPEIFSQFVVSPELDLA